MTPWAGTRRSTASTRVSSPLSPEFNAAHTDRKLAQPNGLRWKLGGIPAAWVEGMYVLHLFTHPRYCEYLHDGRDRQVRRP